VRYCFLQVELDVQARLGVAITTYNVISFTKKKLGDGYAADYCIKVHNYVCTEIHSRYSPSFKYQSKVDPRQAGFTLHVPM